MGNMTLFIAGIAILSLGTYLMRLGGAKLGNRLAFSERSQALLSPMSLGPVLTIDQRHPLQIEPVIQWLEGTIAGQHSGFTDYAYSS